MNNLCQKELLISAYNVPFGGGARLLALILKSPILPETTISLLDSRFMINESKNYIFFKKSILSRLRAELMLRKISSGFKKVLLFGNLPPIFKLNTTSILFVQNKYLVTKYPIKDFNIKARLRILIERMWIKTFIKNVDYVYVQTDHMSKSLQQKLHISREKIIVFPWDEDELVSFPPVKQKTYIKKFLYVASEEPHKNHKLLLEAWENVQRKNKDLELFLTINQKDLPSVPGVTFLGVLTRDELMNLYNKCDVLIYPSLLESFGLPIIEAARLGLFILASDLDFINEMIEPHGKFNPKSPDDIAKSILGFVSNHKNTRLGPCRIKHIFSVNQFLEDLATRC